MIRGVEILDTWLMMIVATFCMWSAILGLYSGNGSIDSFVNLLGGVAAGCFAALLCRGPRNQAILMAPRMVVIACLAYFAWFQSRPWLALDDSALVRGSFEREFFLQRLEQMSKFLLFALPVFVLGVWHGRILERATERTPDRAVGVSPLVGLVATSVGAAMSARLVGAPQVAPIWWSAGAVALGLLYIEMARRVSRAEVPAFVAFAAVVIAMPIILLWP